MEHVKSYLSEERLIVLITSLGFSILTFKYFEPQYSWGIDQPLAWVFNYSFANDIGQIRELVFPHGPLAFLMYPLKMANNYLIAMVFQLGLRIYLVFAVFQLIRPISIKTILLAGAPLFVYLQFTNIQLLIVACAMVSYLLYFTTTKIIWLIFPLALNPLSLLIKSYVGITVSGLSMGWFITESLIFKRWLRSICFALCGTIVFLVIWILLFGDLMGVITFFEGQYYLSRGNSVAASYYPDNNWFLLSIFILSLFVIPFISRTKQVKVLYIFCSPALIAAWLHGMSRQDEEHVRGFFLFILFFAFLILAASGKKYFVNGLLVAVAIFSFYTNYLQNVEPDGFKFQFSFDGILRSVQTYLDPTDSDSLSVRNVQKNRIEKETLRLIGESSVDIYPWDYSLIPANKLRWQPRPVLHSYASYNPWLDEINAAHFRSSKAPDYLIWELEGVAKIFYKSNFESIDYRYQLNNEPSTILTILDRYDFIKRTPSLLLFKKKVTGSNIKKTVVLQRDTTVFDSWLSVPKVNDGILRLKCQIQATLSGRLKSTFYKGDQVFIDYHLTSDSVKWNKVIPLNAVNGIWVNPLILLPETDHTEPIVDRVRLWTGSPGGYEVEIPFQWEHYILSDSSPTQSPYEKTFALFGKKANR